MTKHAEREREIVREREWMCSPEIIFQYNDTRINPLTRRDCPHVCIYSQGLPTMFVFGVGTIDKGAAVSVLSQFPDEEV